MDFYEEDSRPRPSQAWQDARDLVAERDSFRKKAVPVIWGASPHLDSFDQCINVADLIFDAIEIRAQSDMAEIAHLKEQK